jgi:hypothetical protein
MLLGRDAGLKVVMAMAEVTAEMHRRIPMRSSSIPSLRFFIVTDELEIDVQCLQHHIHGK